MPQCHKCPHDGNPTDACIECARREERREAFGSDLTDGHTVSLDALAGTDFEPRIEWASYTPPEATSGDAEAAQSAIPVWIMHTLSDFIHGFLTLSPREMMAVALRFEALRTPDGTPSLAQIGAEIGARCGSPDGGHEPLSKQLVKHILADAAAKVPEIEALFPAMSLTLTERQERRKAQGVQPMQQFLPI